MPKPLLALLLLLPLAIAPAEAAAHGGTTIAEGQRDGVTVLLQGSDATTPAGRPAADLATTLAGPGTGERATVVYWIRPSGGTTFRVAAERDASGVRHAEIGTAGRGDWREWDVSAIVVLGDGTRLRVTNADAPPGPDPARGASDPSAAATPAAVDETSPDATSAAPAGPAGGTQAAAREAAVTDISGEDEAAPGWVLPSVLGLGIGGALALVVARRRRGSV